MANNSNIIGTLLERNPKWATFGPQLYSWVYDQKLEQYVHEISVEIAHGSALDPVYGYFVEIRNERNCNKSRAIIHTPTWVGNPSAPVFSARSRSIVGLNEWICAATETKQIVGTSATADTGATVWESELTYVDAVHREKRTITVVSAPIRKSVRWHAQAEQFVNVTEQAVYKTSGIASSFAGGVLTTYEHLRCDWYIERKETFVDVEIELAGVGEYICTAVRHIKVGARTTLSIPSADVWEGEITEVDDIFEIAKYVLVVTKPLHKSTLWIEEFGQYITVTEQLAELEAYVAPAWVAGTKLYTTYSHLRCKWYLSRVEDYSTLVAASFATVRNYTWPAVLTTWEISPVMAQVEVNGVMKQYIDHIVVDARLKEYSGLCNAHVKREFVTSGIASLTMVDTLMKGDTIRYEGIFFSVSIPECLHVGIAIAESVGSWHPTLVPGQMRSKSYLATTKTDWPNHITLIELVPLSAGFMKETVTIYSPDVAAASVPV